MIKRQPFTIIELLVCFALLTIFGSFAALQGGKMIKTYRYNHAVQHLKDELRLDRQLSISMNIDLTLDFYWVKGVLCARKMDKSGSTTLPLQNRQIKFPEIRYLAIDGIPVLEEGLEIVFHASDPSEFSGTMWGLSHLTNPSKDEITGLVPFGG